MSIINSVGKQIFTKILRGGLSFLWKNDFLNIKVFTILCREGDYTRGRVVIELRNNSGGREER